VAAHAPERVAFQTWLCAERVERLTSLRDLSLAEEWGEHLNNGLNVRVSLDDPFERFDTAVTLDPAYTSKCAL